jgi:phosphoheptose isomerase
VVDDLEETFESAADAAAQQLANTADQVQSAAQGAADSASNFVDSLQSRQLLNKSTLKAAALIDSNSLVCLALVRDLPHDLAYPSGLGVIAHDKF